MKDINDYLTEEDIINAYIEIIKIGSRELSSHYRESIKLRKNQYKEIFILNNKINKAIEQVNHILFKYACDDNTVKELNYLLDILKGDDK